MDFIQSMKDLADQRTTFGNNWGNAAEIALEHPGSAMRPAMEYIGGKLKEKGISKLSTLEFVDPTIVRTDDNSQKCAFCSKEGIKEGVKLSIVANGNINLHEAQSRPIIGKGCAKLAQEFSNLHNSSFPQDFFTLTPHSKSEDKRPTIELGHLSSDVVDILSQAGYTTTDTIFRDYATQFETQIRKGDFTGIAHALDPAKHQRMLSWIINQETLTSTKANPLYEVLNQSEREEIFNLAHLLKQFPEFVKPNQRAKLTTIYEQIRLFPAASHKGEISDILYLSELTKSDPNHILVKDSPVNLGKEAVPSLLHKKTDSVSLQKLVESAYLTIAQSTMMILAVPRLRKRREQHNIGVMDTYATVQEWTSLLSSLNAKYESTLTLNNVEDAVSAIDSKFDIKNYNGIKSLFKDIRLARKLDSEYSIRQYLTTAIPMAEATNVIHRFYVEAQKVRLARELNDDSILRDDYTTKKSALQKISTKTKAFQKDLEANLEALLGAAIEEQPSQPTRDLLNRVPSSKVKELVAELKTTVPYGIIPSRYEQGSLEKALQLASNFKIDSEAQRKVEHLIMLEREGIIQLGDIKAEPFERYETVLKHKRRTHEAIFNTSDYIGKTHFTDHQIKRINAIYDILGPLNLQSITDEDVSKFKEAVKYFTENKIFRTINSSNNWTQIRIDIPNKHSRLKTQYRELMGFYSQKDSHSPISDKDRELLTFLDRTKRVSKYFIDELLADDVLVTPQVKEVINSQYELAINSKIVEGSNLYLNERNLSFTVVATADSPVFRGKLRKERSGVSIGGYQVNSGEWYAQNIKRKDLTDLIISAPLDSIKIVKAYKR